MDAFANFEDNLGIQVALAFQGMLILFFFISPFVGGLIHRGIAKASSLVLIVCSMLLIGNLVYMGMVYVVYRLLPVGVIHPFVWIILSFATAYSLAVLIGRYLNWLMSDNYDPAVWVKEYEALSDADLMPFDRRRKQEMERRKRSRHD